MCFAGGLSGPGLGTTALENVTVLYLIDHFINSFLLFILRGHQTCVLIMYSNASV